MCKHSAQEISEKKMPEHWESVRRKDHIFLCSCAFQSIYFKSLLETKLEEVLACSCTTIPPFQGVMISASV